MNNQYVYNLFLRNWQNGTAKDAHIDAAVEKGLITLEQSKEIKKLQVNAIK